MDAAAIAKRGDARVLVIACLAQKLALALKSATNLEDGDDDVDDDDQDEDE